MEKSHLGLTWEVGAQAPSSSPVQTPQRSHAPMLEAEKCALTPQFLQKEKHAGAITDARTSHRKIQRGFFERKDKHTSVSISTPSMIGIHIPESLLKFCQQSLFSRKENSAFLFNKRCCCCPAFCFGAANSSAALSRSSDVLPQRQTHVSSVSCSFIIPDFKHKL